MTVSVSCENTDNARERHQADRPVILHTPAVELVRPAKAVDAFVGVIVRGNAFGFGQLGLGRPGGHAVWHPDGGYNLSFLFAACFAVLPRRGGGRWGCTDERIHVLNGIHNRLGNGLRPVGEG